MRTARASSCSHGLAFRVRVDRRLPALVVSECGPDGAPIDARGLHHDVGDPLRMQPLTQLVERVGGGGEGSRLSTLVRGLTAMGPPRCDHGDEFTERRREGLGCVAAGYGGGALHCGA